ncbi:LysR family transcriptional regulator [Citrobacter freundii]|uniref:LysR family transcriptional regulator n=1 Tax=unclassified Citrobacter TaxID=2644389 RepID=UPI0019009041|nr:MULTISPECIES: LysR family transcriptional regulator [Citrobacter]MBJ9596166.1 LysR family transcriptional regulator [Citrobacter werkmanii]MBJ9871002.1 LysR family transcriptional regulator [Citrobacter werkmanii]MDK2362177.1 LysR family transcriptional regulator [Citrobacter freundii]MDM2929985.1 LysR family transcriptional regulator [Citrobacter sp. Cm046]MDM2943879.1 LysR family transcriptional regulator [Citrobacter sp. Cm038]
MMKQLKIRDLKILLDLVETKSFSLSAKNVGLTQASISKSIAAVEETLGIKIIDRESRPVRLTAFGETLLPNIRKYIIENDELFELVDHYKKAPSGEVNIFSPSGMQAYLAENILPPLFQRFPDLNVTITTSNHYNADYFKGVSFNNSCDMLISYSPPHNQNLIARKVKRIRMDVFATPAFFEHHPFTTPEELSRHPFILLSSMANNSYENALEFTHEKTAEVKSVNVTGKLKFDNIYTAINCCRNGMGYMVTSHLLLKDTSGIMSVLPPEWGVFIDCYVIYRNRKNLPLRVQLSLDYIIELMTKEK